MSNGARGNFFRPSYYAGLRGGGRLDPFIAEETGYLLSLISPESQTGIKLPDAFTPPTSTYQTILTYQTSGNSFAGSAPNVGRFCVVLKPVLGIVQPISSVFDNNTFVVTSDTVLWTGVVSATSSIALPDPEQTVMIPDTTTGNISGLAMRARCVSASLWAEYEGSSLLDGGSIAAAYLPADTWATKFTSPGGFAQGNYTYWENLADARSSYQGAIKKGAYVWWRPASYTDLQFWPVDRANVNPFSQQALPFLVISGIFPQQPGGTPPFSPPSIRFRACINYEYTTDSRVPPTTPSPYCEEAMKLAEQVLAYAPNAMENERHTGWIAEVAKAALAGAAGFLVGGPVGAAAAILGSGGVAAIKAATAV